MSNTERSTAPRWETPISVLVLRGAEQSGALLDRARSAGAPVAVSAGDDTLRTRVMLVDAYSRSLFVSAELADMDFPRSSTLHVGGQLDGGHFEFDSVFEERVILDDRAALRLALPAQVSYYERRTGFRMAVTPSLGLAPLMLHADNEDIAGEIVDLSSAGAGTLVDASFDTQVGAALECDLTLPELELHTRVEVCSSSRQAGQRRLGLSFYTLKRAQEAHIAGVIDNIRRRLGHA
jgi:hypothetical protein